MGWSAVVFPDHTHLLFLVPDACVWLKPIMTQLGIALSSDYL